MAASRLAVPLSRRRSLIQFSRNFSVKSIGSCWISVFFNFSSKRLLSVNSEWGDPPEFGGLNAYGVLGVSKTSSFEEIKASFRKLAKETHPDLAQSRRRPSYDAKRFLQIVAAYEVLSDSTRRAHYDHYILSQGTFDQKLPKKGNASFRYDSCGNSSDEMVVVEWLKWYRYTVKDILSERRVIAGSGYFDVLETDFYSALHAAYFGPNIEDMDLLPDCFEAEERSMHTTSEVLHLVSGRYLFGMVCLANRCSELPNGFKEKLESSSTGSDKLHNTLRIRFQCDAAESKGLDNRLLNDDYESSDAYSDLELLICGRVIARATRIPPKRMDKNSQDEILVSLIRESQARDAYSRVESSPLGSKVPLGTIKGLGTSSEETPCYVYNASGMKTHVIMKHRTLLVKHLHWFRIGEKVSVCECRCSRARLPPSKLWLFEPRCATHDAGGWYVETFGRDSERKTVPSQRDWDDFNNADKRLHPAMYLLTLAYRTLDIEHATRTKKTIKQRVEARMSRVSSWYKKGS